MTLNHYKKIKRKNDTPKDIPCGEYVVSLINTTNQGSDLILTIEIVKGKYKGRRFHSRW